MLRSISISALSPLSLELSACGGVLGFASLLAGFELTEAGLTFEGGLEFESASLLGSVVGLLFELVLETVFGFEVVWEGAGALGFCGADGFEGPLDRAIVFDSLAR